MKKQILFSAFMALSAMAMAGGGTVAAPLLAEDSVAVADESDSARIAPDFTLTDIDGRELSLSSLRGRYVVLDFWGSWCYWCVKGIPEMKAYYAKYKDKVEFLGIDCRESDDKWKAAVAEYELPWLHVRNQTPDDVPPLYEVPGFPTKVIISPEGTIIKTVVGESPEFYQTLDALFKDE